MRCALGYTLLAVLGFATILCLGPATAGSEGRLDASIRESTSTLQFITALSGAQLTELFAGQSVEFSSLSEPSRQQILDAIETQIGPGGFRETAGSPPLGSRLLLTLNCEFAVVLIDPAFGERGEIRISLSDMGMAASSGSPANPPTPIEDPPALESVLATCAGEKAAKATCLKQQVIQLLTPAGSLCLAQSNVPFNFPDFLAARTLALSSLTPEFASWMKAVYERYDSYVQVQRDKLRELGESSGQTKARATGTAPDGRQVELPAAIAAGHITADNPRYPLPAWPALSSATMHLEVGFTPKVEISGSAKCQIRKFGWVVHL